VTARRALQTPSPAGGRSGWGRLAAVLVTALVAALLLAAAVWAQEVLPVPPLSGRVVDQTGTLSAAQAQALGAKLEAIETQRGAQVVVLIVPTTQPEDIATYGHRVADTWKVGRRDVGDGIVIVVAKNDRRVNIEVAKTLEGAIPDVLAGRIINDQIKPAFKAGDYAGGLNAAVDKLGARIAGEALPEPSRKGGGNASRGGTTGGFDLQDLAIFLFVGVPIAGAVLTGIFGRKLGSLLTGGAVGGIAWWLTTSLLVAGGAGIVALFLVGVMGLGGGRLGGLGGRGGPVIWGGGGGGFGGDGGGGGFSSGGGGDFGGGGASGSW
jgi:uncharacterized protein